MTRVPTMLIIGLFLLAPGLAFGGDEPSYKEAQARYLQTAEEYRAKADDLNGRKGSLEASQQAIVDELVRVYGDLAEIKVALADAVGRKDWDQEEKLEQRYYRLKEDEQKYRDDLERTK